MGVTLLDNSFSIGIKVRYKSNFYQSYKSNMEQPRFGGPLNSPPFFYGSNYPHWNAQIIFFLKVQGEMVWNLVEYGWGPALKLDVNRKSTSELKPKQE